ncbi:hypothetical protein [Flavobacterium sp.]|uniref:hypothetical protein n=1 Tax=Flavobacterium sp. TaxID=239 RepID=UPI0025C0D9F1|nr:hypothetical protein [Flavobacterium sp.]
MGKDKDKQPKQVEKESDGKTTQPKQSEETPKQDVKAPTFEETWKDQDKFQTD